MATVVVDLKDAAKYFGDLKTEFHRGALAGLLSAAARGVQTIQTIIIPSRQPAPVDRGIYRAGWRFVGTSSGAEIFNDDPTAVFVEDGVRGENVKPGRAMVDALTQWVIRKGIAGGDEATSVAWAIIQNMKKRGIFNRGAKGLGIMRELVERYLNGFVFEEVERELKRSLP